MYQYFSNAGLSEPQIDKFNSIFTEKIQLKSGEYFNATTNKMEVPQANK
jgi:hypothetical protein